MKNEAKLAFLAVILMALFSAFVYSISFVFAKSNGFQFQILDCTVQRNSTYEKSGPCPGSNAAPKIENAAAINTAEPHVKSETVSAPANTQPHVKSETMSAPANTQPHVKSETMSAPANTQPHVKSETMSAPANTQP